MRRIYHQQPLRAAAQLQLSDTAAHHLRNVLRVKLAEEVELFDGLGCSITAQIGQISKKSVVVTTGSALQHRPQRNPQIQLQQALAKGERMDWVMQKATELGAASIQPFSCEHSEVKLNAQRLEKKMLHWQQVIIHAAQQCGNYFLPELKPLLKFSDMIRLNHPGQAWILQPDASNAFRDIEKPSENMRVLVGPEGGFSQPELLQAKSQGYQCLTLGPRILRTETAAVAALTVLQYRWGDLA